jgi:hypothetical protein
MTDDSISPLGAHARRHDGPQFRGQDKRPTIFGGSGTLPFISGARPILQPGKMSDATSWREASYCSDDRRTNWRPPFISLRLLT